MLPKPKPLPEKDYSLAPDMALGWVPKMHLLSVKLTFAVRLNDDIIQNGNCLYVGYRPNDSIQLHRQFNLRNVKQQLVYQKPAKFFGMIRQNNVVFDSAFEGGNLDAVVKINDFEYDLLMRVDSNTRGHFSWYNFKVISDAERTVKFNIINFTKPRILYSSGMQPFIKIGDQGWKQGGINVKFEEKPIHYIEHTRRYYTLSYSIELPVGITVQMAYCPPYNYSQMLQEVRKLQIYPWFRQEKLCQDLSGIEVPLITIEQEGFKKVALIQARIHPGESNGSWMMQGFLDYIAQAEELRKKQKQEVKSHLLFLIIYSCLLKIIPMANPDGVIMGNYRTGLAGRDLNREFLETDDVLFPTIYHTKELMRSLIEQYGQEKMFAFIDLHGHSIKKNVFLYGPDYPVWDTDYLKCRMLAKLLDEKTQMFRYYGCIFRVSSNKKSTARGVFNDDVLNCFTIEASNGGYFDEELQTTIKFEPKHWIEMGRIIGECLNELTQQTLLIEQHQEEKLNQKKQKNIKKQAEMLMKMQSSSTTKNKKDYPQQSPKSKSRHQRSLTVSLYQSRNKISKEFYKNQQPELQIKILEDIKKKEQELENQEPVKSESGSDSDSSSNDYTFAELKKLRRLITQQKEILEGSEKSQNYVPKQFKKPKKKKQRSSSPSKMSEKIELSKLIKQQRMTFALNESAQSNKITLTTVRKPRPMKFSWNFSPRQKKSQFQQSVTPYLIIQSSQLPQQFTGSQLNSSFELTRPLTALLERMSFLHQKNYQLKGKGGKSQPSSAMKCEFTPLKYDGVHQVNQQDETNSYLQNQTSKSYSFSNNVANIQRSKCFIFNDEYFVVQGQEKESIKPLLTFHIEQKIKHNSSKYPSAFYQLKQQLGLRRKYYHVINYWEYNNQNEFPDQKTFQLNISGYRK